jgi:hypothetical protein
MSGPNDDELDLSDVTPDPVMLLRPLKVPDQVAAMFPEGEVVSVDRASLLGRPGPAPAAPAAAPVRDTGEPFTVFQRTPDPFAVGSGAAASAIRTSNSWLTQYGFSRMVPGATENSIGLIGFGRWGTAGARIPEGVPPGHTALFVKVNGRLQVVRGFVPKSSIETVVKSSKLLTGETGVTAVVENDVLVFTKVGAVSVEWPVDAEVALRFADQLPGPGPAPASGPQLYTFRAAQYKGVPGEAANCVNWACTQVEQALQGRVGTARPGGATAPLTEPVDPTKGLQGRFMQFAADAAENPGGVGVMPGATGPPLVTRMPTRFRLLKIGGRVMIVIGIGMVIYETYKAPPGQGGRTFARGAGGFVGGLAFGAAAGAMCGPGMLVCSLVFGLAGGLVGAYIGSDVGEAMYDDLSNKALPTRPISLTPRSGSQPGSGPQTGAPPSSGKPLSQLSPAAQAIFRKLSPISPTTVESLYKLNLGLDQTNAAVAELIGAGKVFVVDRNPAVPELIGSIQATLAAANEGRP